jgi:type I restriction enzyme S subunit
MQDVGRKHRTASLTTSTDKVSSTAIATYRLRLFPAGSLLIPKSGASVNLNHRAMLGCDAYVVSHLSVVVPDRQRLLPEYLYYWSLSYDPRSQAQTTSLPSLPLSLIKAAPIPVPTIDEQRRIVDLLARAEGIVRLRREAEKKAAELIPALFLDMFGDPATNPRGWAIASISTVCDKCATTDPRKTPQAGFTYIDIASIDNGRGSIVEPKPLVGRDAPSRARQVVRSGDVIISTVRPNLRGSAMVPEGLDGEICSTGFCVLRPKTTGTSAFIFAVARSDWFVEEMMKKVRGAQYPAITNKDIFGHPIPVPPITRQTAFSEKFADISAIQHQQALATAKAQETFDALLAGVFCETTH